MKHNVISKERQEELLMQYPDETYYGHDVMDGKITEDDGYFLLVQRVLNSDYAKPMSLFDFYIKVNNL